MRQYLLYGQYLLYALLYCFEPPLETIQCKLASVNNLCWWLIENNWTWIRATYQLLFDLQHRLIMQKALQFHSLIPWSRTLFQFTNFVSWMTSKLFLHKFLICWGHFDFVSSALLICPIWSPDDWIYGEGWGSLSLLPSHNCSITSLSLLPMHTMELPFMHRWIVQLSMR